MLQLNQPKYSSEITEAGCNKIQTTLTDLYAALTNLQDKCCNEEEAITTMIKDIKAGGFSKIFDGIIGRDNASDINKDLVTIRDHSETQSSVKYLFQSEESSTMKITNVRLICDDSILVKWLRPHIKSVVGYEIRVDGTLKSKVRSATRNSAVIFNLNLEKEITVEVYAVTPLGLYETPATAIFRPESDSS